MKIAGSRKRTDSIMAHSGFGILKISLNGKTTEVMPEEISQAGTLKSYALKRVNKVLKGEKSNERTIRKNTVYSKRCS